MCVCVCVCVPRNFDLFVCITNKIAIDISKAIIPPRLFGINRKLRMQIGNVVLVECILVLIGDLLWVNLSGFLNMYGSFRVNIIYI